MSSATVSSVRISRANGIGNLNFLLVGGSAKAELEMSDGSQEVFAWFDDEVDYTVAAFAGKTMSEIRALHYERDIAYLRS